ncbi:MAG: type I restriction-modification system subunit M N-terminal domain-containing protein, partial [Myxococcota bacterium]
MKYTMKRSEPYPETEGKSSEQIQSDIRELRGGMDASQYKDYVLTMLFVKYVSD